MVYCVKDEEPTYMQTLDTNRIHWSENCVDPGSRVFFIDNRVFRAYEDNRKQETLEFLNSDCYTELKEKQMIVRSWIADEIQLEGYPLILEHEHLCCMPEKWLCFEMLKEILAFHFEVNKICHKYGYGLRDIGYGNVTLKNGRLCFTDFGSFRRIENIDPNIYEQYCLPLAYLPLAIYSKNDGNDFVADCFIGDYDKWITAQKKPVSDTLLTNHLRSYIHPIVRYYNLRFRKSNIHWRAKTGLVMWLIQKLNETFMPLIPPKYAGRNFIDIGPIYSCGKVEKQLRKIQFPYQGESMYPVSKQPILLYVPDVVSKYVGDPIKRIVLWGNFLYKEVAILRQTIKGEMIVMSNDRLYCNHLYKQIRSHQDDIAVICCNVMRGKDFMVFGALKTDVLILQDGVYKQAYIGSHSDWAERASHFADYVIVSTLNQEVAQVCRMQAFYSLDRENQDAYWQLYKNRHQ